MEIILKNNSDIRKKILINGKIYFIEPKINTQIDIELEDCISLVGNKVRGLDFLLSEIKEKLGHKLI